MERKDRIKLYPEDLRRKSKKELLEMKRTLERAFTETKMYDRKRGKGISPRETRRNIARINTVLKEKNGNHKNRDKST